MQRIGIAGIGFMGMVHYLSYQKVKRIRVAALASDEPVRRAGDWRGIKGNFGPPGQKMDLSGIEVFDDALKLVASDSVNAIDITLPPALHAPVAMAALAAGKHVFCEKPIALNLADAKRMMQAAAKAKRLLMIGHVLPFFPEYAWALKVIASGEFGRPIGGAFRRVISDPAWLKSYWVADKVGGPMLDLHVHDAHFIRLVFGKPVSVVTTGRTRNGLAEFWHSQFTFAGADTVVEATSGTINQQGRPFDHGFEIHLERATLVFQFATYGKVGTYLCPPTIFTPDGKAKRVKLGDGDPMHAFATELKHVVASLASGVVHPVLDPQLAVDAVAMCEAQTKSIVSGRAARV